MRALKTLKILSRVFYWLAMIPWVIVYSAIIYPMNQEYDSSVGNKLLFVQLILIAICVGFLIEKTRLKARQRYARTEAYIKELAETGDEEKFKKSVDEEFKKIDDQKSIFD